MLIQVWICVRPNLGELTRPLHSLNLALAKRTHVDVGKACLVQSGNFPLEVDPVRCYADVAYPVH